MFVQQSTTQPAAQMAPRRLTLQDPVQSSQTCEAWVSPKKVMLRRNVAGMTMYLAVDLKNYHGIVAREGSPDSENNSYSVHLLGPNSDLNLQIGSFDLLDQMAESWADWGKFTNLPMLVETESGALRPLSPKAKHDRRKGAASALKYRRRRYAAFRAKPDLNRAATSFRGAREISAYE